MPFLFCVVIISTILTGKNVTFLVLHVIGIIKPWGDKTHSPPLICSVQSKLYIATSTKDPLPNHLYANGKDLE